MKKILGIILSVCFCLLGSAQNQGIQFVNGVSWQQIQAQAKKEHKFIFMDCYTTWCGPCKYMAKNIFPLKESGDALNPEFISVSVQLDTSRHDSDATKSWYADAHMIATRYKVTAFPTYLFFNSEGEIIHRAVGSTQDAGKFISYTKNALNPEKQYYTLLSKYEKGNRDTILLETLTQQATANSEDILADATLGAWLAGIKDPFTKERLAMLADLTTKPEDPAFNLFYQNTGKIDKITKPRFAEGVIMNCIILQSQEIATLFKDTTSVPYWDRINGDIAKQFNTEYAHHIVAFLKVNYYKRKKQYDIYARCLVDYLKVYAEEVGGMELNNYAYDIFQYCSKPEDLAVGLNCSLRTLTGTQKLNAGYLDTYANLLYKSGQHDEAIEQESKAIELIDAMQRPAYQATLEKMKSGQKTWN